MECREIGNLMMKYLDSDINDMEMDLLNAHIKNCTCCDQEFDMLKEAVLAVGELPELDLSHDFDLRVMEAIREQPVYNRSKESMCMGIGTIGLIAFVCYIGIFFTLPFIVESGIMNTLTNYMAAGINIAIGYLLGGLVDLVLLIGKISILRDIFISNFIGIINIVLVLLMLNMIVVRNIMQKRLQH